MATLREAFDACVDEIKSEELRALTRSVLDELCPAGGWFWRASASMSGVHHPPACRGVGGLARHTLLAYAWLRELLEVFTDAHRDAARVAVLLHDARKYESADSPPVHGALAADSLLSTLTGYESADTRTAVEIASLAVRTHMGGWSSTPERVGAMTPTSCVVHLADYCASRDVDPERLKEVTL